MHSNTALLYKICKTSRSVFIFNFRTESSIHWLSLIQQGYIDASEDGFDATVALGNQMIQDDYEAKDEIGEKVALMELKRKEMIELWESKKLEYDQRSELQTFNRDIEQMEAIIVKQEVLKSIVFIKK